MIDFNSKIEKSLEANLTKIFYYNGQYYIYGNNYNELYVWESKDLKTWERNKINLPKVSEQETNILELMIVEDKLTAVVEQRDRQEIRKYKEGKVEVIESQTKHSYYIAQSQNGSTFDLITSIHELQGVKEHSMYETRIEPSLQKDGDTYYLQLNLHEVLNPIQQVIVSDGGIGVDPVFSQISDVKYYYSKNLVDWQPVNTGKMPINTSNTRGIKLVSKDGRLAVLGYKIFPNYSTGKFDLSVYAYVQQTDGSWKRVIIDEVKNYDMPLSDIYEHCINDGSQLICAMLNQIYYTEDLNSWKKVQGLSIDSGFGNRPVKLGEAYCLIFNYLELSPEQKVECFS